MIATAVLVLLTVAFFEAVSRSGTPREARRPLATLTMGEHLIAAWAGVVLLTRSHQRGRPSLGIDDPHRPCTSDRQAAAGGGSPTPLSPDAPQARC